MAKLLGVLFLFVLSVGEAAASSPALKDCGKIPLPDNKHVLHRYCVTLEVSPLNTIRETVYVVENLGGEIVAGATTDYQQGKSKQSVTAIVSPTPVTAATPSTTSAEARPRIVGIDSAATNGNIVITCSHLITCLELAKAFANYRVEVKTKPGEQQAEIIFRGLSLNQRLAVLERAAKMQ